MPRKHKTVKEATSKCLTCIYKGRLKSSDAAFIYCCYYLEYVKADDITYCDDWEEEKKNGST